MLKTSFIQERQAICKAVGGRLDHNGGLVSLYLKNYVAFFDFVANPDHIFNNGSFLHCLAKLLNSYSREFFGSFFFRLAGVESIEYFESSKQAKTEVPKVKF